MSVLRIDASIQGERSASSALADLVLEELTSHRPGTDVVRRHLGAEPLPADAWPLAVGGSFTPEADRTPQQQEAVELAGTVAEELRSAEAAVLALPLYNWGVSQHVKAWVDLAIAGAEPGARLLDGTPVVALVTRGGSYAPGTPKEGWDHSTDYLRRILVDVWGGELTLIERELTLAGVNPAMEGLVDLGTDLRRTAEEAAVLAGAELARRAA
ncbi:NAD(P)H-dependent oxidoreductase [Phycicoccus endophyticus]|uniref:FMN dependent NADH:quinone oxidoreductase n=1 Tax=Phycicoccus endophyticus TaxID=1690220 RepID=A0A7G9QYV2_9MICO|nr:NAD(P)H-dependent oxidoreductase [Phycicoccus endophyticus]NHI20426.1 flavodoxin family protein [Phycicoccus endophyticus]QNN48527.1 NAD(P)H-dependent oxidoreductase [Phycicoccus endophyticus]GGL30928.1 FMN-dependent NADH-azoreductase [Phycicoccus endophyticus]